MRMSVTLFGLIHLFGLAASQFVFTKELLDLTLLSVRLSDLAYSNGPLSADSAMKLYNDEPDQVVFGFINGYCMAAFRGTVLSSWNDMFQNVRLGDRSVCQNDVCCNVEVGFYAGYEASYQDELEQQIRACAASYCGEETCPVVLTGASQGGAIAAAAAIHLNDLDPTVITFGQPPTIDAPCQLINSDKFFRFENSRVGNRGTTYDPVPYLPYPASLFGHQIMLGEDPTGVAYIGKDTQVSFSPWDAANGFATHRLQSQAGYLKRIESLASYYMTLDEVTVRSTGFVDGFACSKDVECDSGHCDNERCRRRRLREAKQE